MKSLRNFLAAGFNRSIFIYAPDHVAANHLGIKIEGAFFAIIKERGADEANEQCHANVSTLYLSRVTLSDLGVLSPTFLLLGAHPPLNTHEQNSTTKLFCAPIRSASGGCSSLGQSIHTCACPQRIAVSPPPSSLLFS